MLLLACLMQFLQDVVYLDGEIMHQVKMQSAMVEKTAAAADAKQIWCRTLRQSHAVERVQAAMESSDMALLCEVREHVQSPDELLAYLSVAWLTICAVSCISTMKLLEFVSMLSEVPMRVNSLSTTCMEANLAGTKLPICAMMTMSATCIISASRNQLKAVR